MWTLPTALEQASTSWPWRWFLSWESYLLCNLHLSSQVPATMPLYWETYSDVPGQKPQFPQSSHLVVLLDDTLGGQCVGLKAPGQAQHFFCQLLLEVLVLLQDEV